MSKKLRIIFYSWFMIVPIVVILLDTFLSTIYPASSTDSLANFDASIINQAFYLSIWVSLTISLWGTLNFINELNNKMPKWVSSLTFKNYVVTLTIFMFIIFFAGGLADIQGTFGNYNIWYKATKSIIEHFVTPILMLVFFFFNIDQPFSMKEYLKKKVWYLNIFISVYLIIVVIRDLMLVKFAQNTDWIPFMFPYAGFDPFKKPLWFSTVVVIILESSLFGLGTFFMWINNAISNKKLNKQLAFSETMLIE